MRSMPVMREYKRTSSLLDSTNKYDNIMFPDAQQLQQLKSSPRDESELHPIYVLPPPNFQPVIFPTSKSDGIQSGAKLIGNKELTLTLPPRSYPYVYPHGVSSWVFGGVSGLQRGSYWEQLSSDLALQTPVKVNQPNRIIVYLKRTLPAGQTSGQTQWSQIPTYEAHSVIDPQSDNKVIKTKLPVGLTSFFLGGMRGVSGRHWQMPSTLVEQVEFMPKHANSGKPLTDNEKKKIEYKPAVQFDDETDLYNVIKLD